MGPLKLRQLEQLFRLRGDRERSNLLLTVGIFVRLTDIQLQFAFHGGHVGTARLEPGTSKHRLLQRLEARSCDPEVSMLLVAFNLRVVRDSRKIIHFY